MVVRWVPSNTAYLNVSAPHHRGRVEINSNIFTVVLICSLTAVWSLQINKRPKYAGNERIPLLVWFRKEL